MKIHAFFASAVLASAVLAAGPISLSADLPANAVLFAELKAGEP